MRIVPLYKFNSLQYPSNFVHVARCSIKEREEQNNGETQLMINSIWYFTALMLSFGLASLYFLSDCGSRY